MRATLADCRAIATAQFIRDRRSGALECTGGACAGHALHAEPRPRQGPNSIPTVALGAAAKDPCLPLAERWLASFAEHNALWLQYDLEEERLINLLGIQRFQAEWDAEQPRTRILTELDGRMAALWDERVRLAEALTAVPARSFAGAAAKVAVARDLIEPNLDEGNARPLLARARRFVRGRIFGLIGVCADRAPEGARSVSRSRDCSSQAGDSAMPSRSHSGAPLDAIMMWDKKIGQAQCRTGGRK